MSEFTPHEAPIREAQNLPVPLPANLVGRDAALAQVYAVLKENKPVLIHGPAGVGKTGLAAKLASAYASQSGGVLWLNVDNPRLEELLVRVGRAYQITEVTTNESPLGFIGAVENTLRAQKPLVVLDGRIQPDVVARFISRCVNGLPLIMTHSDKIEGPWAALPLEPLTSEQAAALFKQEARITDDTQDIDVYGLVKLVGYLPLGVVIAARSLAANKMTAEDLLKQMSPVAKTAGNNSPAIALTVAFSKLNGALQGLILMLAATFEGRASAEIISKMSNAPVESVQQAMNILAQLYFVQRSRRYDLPYYALHPLVQTFAQAGLRKSGKLDTLQGNMGSGIVNYVTTYAAAGNDDKLAAEMDNVLATARWAAQNAQDSDIVNDLVTALTQAGDFVRERGYLYDLIQLRAMTGTVSAFPAYSPEDLPSPEDMALVDDEDEYDEDDEYAIDEDALESVEAVDDDDEEVAVSSGAFDAPDFLNQIGTAEMGAVVDYSGKDVSELRSLLAQAKQSSNADEQLRVLKAIGKSQTDAGMENEAISTYNEILSLHEDTGNREGELETLDMLAALMSRTENAQAAVMNATRGIRLAEDLNDNETQMQLLITLGDARQQLGESTQAVQDYSRALQIARQSDDSQNEAIALYKLGYAQLDDSDPETAITTWEQALELFKAQGKRSYEGRTLGGLGNAYGDLERWAEAVNYHTSALHIAREVNDTEEEALQLNSLAYAAYQANQLGEAVLRYRQALHMAYATEDRNNIVSTIVDLSRLLLQSRMYVDIVNMLVDAAAQFDPNDKDLVQLQERINSEKALAQQYGTKLKPVKGTARDYAANAYSLLDA